MQRFTASSMKRKRYAFTTLKGKFFMQSFLDFLLPHDFVSRMSTSPNGDHQPGAFEVTWVVKNKSQRAAAISETCDRQERVADVVAYHTTKCYFAVVVEIKSGSSLGRTQQFEQMVGLFHPQQAVMLGLTVGPDKMSPRILLRTNDGSLVLHELESLEHLTGKGLETLAALVVAISRNSLDYAGPE